jgi:hypothetical protein
MQAPVFHPRGKGYKPVALIRFPRRRLFLDGPAWASDAVKVDPGRCCRSALLAFENARNVQAKPPKES